MQKYLLLIALLSLSAAPGRYYESLMIVHEEYKLNSGSRPGGHSRAMITIPVPRHCDYIIYSAYASPRNPLQDLCLHTQLRDRLHKDGAGLSIGSSILNNLTAPPADGVTDVVLIQKKEDALQYMDHQPAPVIEAGSRYNVANCIVYYRIPYSPKPDTLYMCLRNPGAFIAEFVTVEICVLQRH